MTSTNDGKEVKKNIISGPKGKTYYIELYKSLESALTESQPLPQRTAALCNAWRQLHSLCSHSAPSTHPHLLTWIQKHTATTVLQTEWRAKSSENERQLLENAIDSFVAEARAAIAGRSQVQLPWERQLVARAEWFKKLSSDPWGHAVLLRILDQRGEQPNDDEVLEWLKEERGVVFVSRLRQLVASKCDDIALTLASSVMDRVRRTEPPNVDDDGDVKPLVSSHKTKTFGEVMRSSAGFSADILELLIDIEFVLLDKLEKRKTFIDLAKQTPLKLCYQLAERLRTRLETSPKEKRLWKNAKHVATTIAQVSIARCMVLPRCTGGGRACLYWMARVLARLLARTALAAAASVLAAPAASARHLHTFTAALHAECSDDMKPFICELYIRAITAGMNELERLKLKTEKENETEARVQEALLASWFVSLGGVLSASARIRAECDLTAFSLHPAPNNYERLKNSAPPPILLQEKIEPKLESVSDFGSWANDSRANTNFVKTSESLNLKINLQQINVLSTAILVEGEALGLSLELCQDLAVLLSGPRVKTFTWEMNHEELLANCRAYMERTGGGTKALTTELKYLNLDPSQFSHLPEESDGEDDIYYGIEKGYEKHLPESEREPQPEQIWADALSDHEKYNNFDSESEEVYGKKKSRRHVPDLDDEKDPLSLQVEIAHTDGHAKERPRSKERRKKHKVKKLIDPKEQSVDTTQELDEKTKREMIRKEKKERKKKEKLDRALAMTANSINELVGLRVDKYDIADFEAKANKPFKERTKKTESSEKKEKKEKKGKKHKDDVKVPTTDRDGLTLMASPEAGVVFDGIFSMDDLKTISPEKAETGSSVIHSLNSLSTPTPMLKLKLPTVNMETQTPASMPTQTPASMPTQTLASLPRPPKKETKEEIKQRIAKLLSFRKQRKEKISQHCANQRLNQQIHPAAVTTAASLPYNLQSTTTTTSVMKSREVQMPCEKVDSVPVNNQGKVLGSPIINVYSRSTVNKPVIKSVNNLQTQINSLPCVQNHNKDNSEIKYANEKSLQAHKTESARNENMFVNNLAQDLSVVVKSPSGNYRPNILLRSNTPKQKIPKQKEQKQTTIGSPMMEPQSTNLSENQPKLKSMKDFINEIQQSLNAGIKSDPNLSNLTLMKGEKSKQDAVFNSLLNAKVIPVPATTSTTYVAPPTTKTATKQMEGAPNTFSRLNYLHKNKVDIKQAHYEGTHMTQKEAISNELERHIAEFKLAQLERQNQGSLIVHRSSKKATAHNNPVLAQILTAPGDKSKLLSTLNKNTAVTKAPTPMTYSPGATMDRELMNLLHQKAILNQTHLKRPSNSSVKINQQEPFSSGVSLKTTEPAIKALMKAENKLQINNHVLTSLEAHKATATVAKVPKASKKINKTKKRQSNKAPTNSMDILQPQIQKEMVQNVYTNNVDAAITTTFVTKDKLVDPSKTVTEPHKQLNWETVMDQLLSHKTPARGPNALNLALSKKETKFTIQQNSANKSNVIANVPMKQTCNLLISHDKSINLKKESQPPAKEHSEIKILNVQNFPVAQLRKYTKEKRQPDVKQSQKPVRKLLSGDKLLLKNTPKLPVNKQIDDEYALLEELIDRDLQQEIDELTSDEETNALCLDKTTCKPTDKEVIKMANPKSPFITNEVIGSTNTPTCSKFKENKTIHVTKNSKENSQQKYRQPSILVTTPSPNIPTQNSVQSAMPQTYTITNQTNSDVLINVPVNLSNMILVNPAVPCESYAIVQDTFILNSNPNVMLYSNTFSTAVANHTTYHNEVTDILPSKDCVEKLNAAESLISMGMSGQSCIDHTSKVLEQRYDVHMLQGNIAEDVLVSDSLESSTRIIKKTAEDKKEHLSINTDCSNQYVRLAENEACQSIETKDVKENVLSQTKEDLRIAESSVGNSILDILEKPKEKGSAKRDPEDIERLITKRNNILNRVTYHKDLLEPIPLTYAPLLRSSNKENADINIDNIISLAKDSTVEVLPIGKAEKELPITKKDSKIPKETVTKPCRRILLRSSNYLKEPKPITNVTVEIKSADPTKKRGPDKVKQKKQSRTNVCSNSLKKSKNKAKTSKRKEPLAKEGEPLCKESNPYSALITELDFEEALSTSIIPKTVPELESDNLNIKNKTLLLASSSEPDELINKELEIKDYTTEKSKNELDKSHESSAQLTIEEKCEPEILDPHDRLMLQNFNSKGVNLQVIRDIFDMDDNSSPISSQNEPNNMENNETKEHTVNISNENVLAPTNELCNTNSQFSTPATSSKIYEIKDDAIQSDKDNIILSNDDEEEFLKKVIVTHLYTKQKGERLEKCVRVKLPNNKPFKVTVNGSTDFDIKSLLANTDVKSIINSNWNEVKQFKLCVSHSNDKNKVLNAKEIKHCPETIDLLSDDEPEEPKNNNLLFKTESGCYKIQSTDTYSHKIHQDKLLRKSFVKLIRHPNKFYGELILQQANQPNTGDEIVSAMVESLENQNVVKTASEHDGFKEVDDISEQMSEITALNCNNNASSTNMESSEKIQEPIQTNNNEIKKDEQVFENTKINRAEKDIIPNPPQPLIDLSNNSEEASCKTPINISEVVDSNVDADENQDDSESNNLNNSNVSTKITYARDFEAANKFGIHVKVPENITPIPDQNFNIVSSEENREEESNSKIMSEATENINEIDSDTIKKDLLVNLRNSSEDEVGNIINDYHENISKSEDTLLIQTDDTKIKESDAEIVSISDGEEVCKKPDIDLIEVKTENYKQNEERKDLPIPNHKFYIVSAEENKDMESNSKMKAAEKIDKIDSDTIKIDWLVNLKNSSQDKGVNLINDSHENNTKSENNLLIHSDNTKIKESDGEIISISDGEEVCEKPDIDLIEVKMEKHKQNEEYKDLQNISSKLSKTDENALKEHPINIASNKNDDIKEDNAKVKLENIGRVDCKNALHDILSEPIQYHAANGSKASPSPSYVSSIGLENNHNNHGVPSINEPGSVENMKFEIAPALRISEVIELDDTSSDSLDNMVPNISKIIENNMLPNILKIENKSDELVFEDLKSMVLDDYGVLGKPTVISNVPIVIEDLTSDEEKPVQLKHKKSTKQKLKRKKVNKNLTSIRNLVREAKTRKCFVKLTRCDSKTPETIILDDDDTDECVVRVTTDDVNVNIIESDDELVYAEPDVAQRSASPSILDSFWPLPLLPKKLLTPSPESLQIEDESHNGKTSPVMEIYDKIASLMSIKPAVAVSGVSIECSAEWFETKRKISCNASGTNERSLVYNTFSLSYLVLKFISQNLTMRSRTQICRIRRLKPMKRKNNTRIVNTSKKCKTVYDDQPQHIETQVLEAPCDQEILLNVRMPKTISEKYVTLDLAAVFQTRFEKELLPDTTFVEVVEVTKHQLISNSDIKFVDFKEFHMVTEKLEEPITLGELANNNFEMQNQTQEVPADNLTTLPQSCDNLKILLQDSAVGENNNVEILLQNLDEPPNNLRMPPQDSDMAANNKAKNLQNSSEPPKNDSAIKLQAVHQPEISEKLNESNLVNSSDNKKYVANDATVDLEKNILASVMQIVCNTDWFNTKRTLSRDATNDIYDQQCITTYQESVNSLTDLTVREHNYYNADPKAPESTDCMSDEEEDMNIAECANNSDCLVIGAEQSSSESDSNSVMPDVLVDGTFDIDGELITSSEVKCDSCKLLCDEVRVVSNDSQQPNRLDFLKTKELSIAKDIVETVKVVNDAETYTTLVPHTTPTVEVVESDNISNSEFLDDTSDCPTDYLIGQSQILLSTLHIRHAELAERQTNLNSFSNDVHNLNSRQLEVSKDSETEDDTTPLVSPCNTENEMKCSTPLSEDGIVIQGIEIEDPLIGRCYIFQPIGDSASETDSIRNNDSPVIDSDSLNNSSETIYEIVSNNGEDSQNSSVDSINSPVTLQQEEEEITQNQKSIETSESPIQDLHTIDFSVIPPKNTYFRKIYKRKLSMCDIKIPNKKYRKGKNIDTPKHVSNEGVFYGKEFKKVMDYVRNLSFSYSIPFHKDYIDIETALHDWPVKSYMSSPINPDVTCTGENILFVETQDIVNKYDPKDQTLDEEMSQNIAYEIENSIGIQETNFKTGFGEGSGRVNQNFIKGGDHSKFSAATLSDVKQNQPILMSEDCKKKCSLKFKSADEVNVSRINEHLRYLNLRRKVKSFFERTRQELEVESGKNPKGYKYSHDLLRHVPGLYEPDFLIPASTVQLIQVVQVGQPPVSAAAQNPVTCDPRVTQVSDASPSQCCVDNSPGSENGENTKAEYTELTNADLSMLQCITKQTPTIPQKDVHINTEQSSTSPFFSNIESSNNESQTNTDASHNQINMVYQLERNVNELGGISQDNITNSGILSTITTTSSPITQHGESIVSNGSSDKTDQIAHAMNAAGITITTDANANTRPLVNFISQKVVLPGNTINVAANNYQKTQLNTISLQQALTQILPAPLNQSITNNGNLQSAHSNTGPQVLHIVQGKNANGNHLTLLDNNPQTVLNASNATQVLHIVQNKSANSGTLSNGTPTVQPNTFGGLSLVDASLQGGNQLLHIVNSGGQKSPNAGQLLKRVNLLTNLANVQGTNDQKMVQFVCKAADGKAIHLNAPQQRGMVLRLQPIENTSPAAQSQNPKSSQEESSVPSKDNSNQQEIKSRSLYMDNYSKFVQDSNQNASALEKSTSLPKFNQAFGKPLYQEGTSKESDNINNSSILQMSNSETDSQNSENNINLDHVNQLGSPPILLCKTGVPSSTAPTQQNMVQQLKHALGPMNIQTMHGGVIYTRQIPVNIGGGQTINLITVPTTELVDESGQKQQNDLESSIIKIVSTQPQTTSSTGNNEENNIPPTTSTENSGQASQPTQPVLAHMRIKLPMLSKPQQVVSGARVVRPSFFQIQRNIVGGANQHVFQQYVLTTAPPLGQQTIRLPQAQIARQVKVPTDSQSSPQSHLSSSTLEQLREFDMVLEQVKERSTVQPSTPNSFTKLQAEVTDSPAIKVGESNQSIIYSIGSNQTVNVAYVSRKPSVPTTCTFIRSPDSTAVDTPSTAQIIHGTNDSNTADHTQIKSKIASKSIKSRPSKPPLTPTTNTIKVNSIPPKPSTQKPLEDEQTTQRILYILAEYKEQVENSPDKDKPAPRRRTNPPTNPSGSSKRKKSSGGSRRPGCTRDHSPVTGEDTCRTMGSEDSSCGTSQGDCTENCGIETGSPQDSPRKVVRKLAFDQETTLATQSKQALVHAPPRNVIVADGQTITVARSTTQGKPATAVLMPANYILPVSMVKGGQQIAIVTNRGPKLLTVGGATGDGTASNTLLLQRFLGGAAGLKPVIARPGVRHVRLPTTALQAFNLTSSIASSATATTTTSSSVAMPTPELVQAQDSSSWVERDSSKSENAQWSLQTTSDNQNYNYDSENVTSCSEDNRTVLDAIPDRYSPDLEAQRIFDKMFEVDTKKTLGDSNEESPRVSHGFNIQTDCDDRAYTQVVQRKDGTSHGLHRVTHISAAALRHKYAMLDHELKLQKSLSEECEDLGVDSPSASELFPEAELLFAASPAAHDDHASASHAGQGIIHQPSAPSRELEDQLAAEHLLAVRDSSQHELTEMELSVGGDDTRSGQIDEEEFARAHPNTTFHTEPTDDVIQVQPFTLTTGLKSGMTSTIFHASAGPTTVLMSAPQSVIAQPNQDTNSLPTVKFSEISNIINVPASHNPNANLNNALPKNEGLTRYEILANRELHLSNTASAIVHASGTQVIKRVCYDDDKRSFLMDETDIIAGNDAKMAVAEEDSRDARLQSIAADDDRSSPDRPELFWESNSASERSVKQLEYSSDSEKCCKSPSLDETNSTDSSGIGSHMRLDSVIKEARSRDRSGSVEGSSADDAVHPPLRTYPAKRSFHSEERSLSGKTRAGECPDSPELPRRSSVRGVVKRGCQCCNGSPTPSRKKPRQKKPTMDFHSN